MQATPPQIPAAATAIVGSNFYKFNGLWSFTSSSHPGMWDAQKFALAPRAAWRSALTINRYFVLATPGT